MTQPTIVIIPGNGGSQVDKDNWYSWLRNQLMSLGYPVVMTDMPDPVAAHMNIWLPYIQDQLVKDPQNTIIIGHSSGAVATLRYLENHHLKGAVLVGCNYTDMGFDDEKEAGWYQDPWHWDQIKANADWIVQLHSQDDPFIPLSEVEHIHKKLSSKLIMLKDKGHFMVEQAPQNNTIPEVVEIISDFCGTNN